MTKPQDCKKDKAWELFKEDSKKENEDKKNANAARKSKPRTGSGGLDSIKVEFFKYYRGYPTTMQLEEIKHAGGFKEWIKTQEASEFKFDARDYAGKGPTQCIFKAKEASKKNDAAGTSKSNVEAGTSKSNVEAGDPLGDRIVSIDASGIVSDSDDLDIVGLFDEEKENEGDDTNDGGVGNAEENNSGSSANTEMSSSYESSSGNSSGSTSSSMESDSEKDGSGSDKDGSLKTRPTPPFPKKKTVRDVCKDIYNKRGELEPSVPEEFQKI